MTAEVLALLLGAGGAGGLAGLINVLMAMRKGRLENEETLIRRLNEDSKQQGLRADEAETRADTLRRQRDTVWEQAAMYRRQLLELGARNVEPLKDFHDA